ncbi:UDP-N-acetylglucosamine 2-epimerase [Oceanihabitans sp. 2_MG-2023]|uniref:UDP-N-acetylglucosamine 2-epimerase n=1 Tax=Oceanihabitans sp. 2_MG-2023 TaxID=3062661 RepID=UPI0026E229A7|nr:UDP-N-acetylglucosamine 2-epimerase [Oceanihabitans sp. 2_MG-2023]MDO6595883.1 UDP-N-acetylglucosamine 2-epimerase [Oceanihabitans sp. 2_MG-2023]
MRKIAIVTGTRAEYGLLKPLISKVNQDKNLELQLLVTGMHLSPEFGMTINEIEDDGFPVIKKAEVLLSSDTGVGVIKSMGLTMISFSEALTELKPDIVIVLGDRTEIFSVVISAYTLGIPVFHISGGETTEGAYDEGIRHAITKMSYLHFTSTALYQKRVIQLGESPDRVFNVGAIGIDSIKSLKLLNKQEFEKSIDFKLYKKSVLITFHPVTLENVTAKSQFSELLKALDTLEDTSLIFTKPNSDKDGRIIINMIDDYVSKNNEKAIAFISLGQLRYLSAIKHVDVVVGNSSSGITEVPVFKKPTINIGDRQKGRLMPESVINCMPNQLDIEKAMEQSLSSNFMEQIQNQENPYGNGDTAEQIMEILKKTNIKSIKKSFYDL